MKRLFILFIAIATVALAMAQNTNDAVVIYKNNVAKKAFRMNQVDSIVLRNSSDVSPDIFESFFENFKVLSSEGVEGQKLGEKDGVWTVCLNAKNADTEKLSFTFDIGGDYKLYANGKEIESGDIVEPGLDAYGLCNPVELSLKQDDEIISTWAVKAYYFDLPTVYINTPDYQAITSKDLWIEGATISLWTTDGKIDTFEDAGGKAQIKGRGNQTWGFPKKPYTFKFDKKCKVLGMPKDKRWNLLANWKDRTRIRNAVAYKFAKETDSLDWTPNGEYIELILNGEHRGLYYLCEHIKIAKDRVNVTEMESTDIEEPNITGGYLIELDKYFDEVNKFKSSTLNIPVNFKEPDEEVLVGAQFNYFRDYFNEIESKITSDTINETNYKDLMDIESFIDFWFVAEASSNADTANPGSFYLHKDRNGKLKAGPVWDYDGGTYIHSREKQWIVKNKLWYNYLFNDNTFRKRVKEKWSNEKARFYNLQSYIDEMSNATITSAKRDVIMWPFSDSHNNEQNMTYEEAIAQMKNALKTKLDWMEKQISVEMKPIYIIKTITDKVMGTIYPSYQDVEEGDEARITATANYGYKFINWTEDGKEIGTDVTLIIKNVTSDHCVAANFEALETKTVTVGMNNDEWGKVNITNKKVVIGDNLTITATPNKGFLFENWTENGEVIGTNATITLDDVTADHHIVANFKIDPDYVPDTANVDNNETDGEGDAKQEIDF